ncbi:glycosyltransferase [Homoserinibacter sp. GY 40078]|uniref:glycosyltransferase n=1 Tax=Homoserinibacter sp. GY 40078 TaxID=2603275 RepID=UPI0011C93E25|nr:glycosyltransferase family 1 protein [Homoserinibacter sp. GY 40078]TXK16988.1 glycosyltransferase family 1 protein [Homoserinibacter sp. GY 40078]
MKVAFISQPGLGHLTGLGRLAQEFLQSGHEVVAFGAPSVAAYFSSAGARARAAAEEPPGSASEFTRGLIPDYGALSSEERLVALRNRVSIGHRADGLIDGLRLAMRETQPDLVIRDSTEIASWLVADEIGVPHLAFDVSHHWSEKDWWVRCGDSIGALLGRRQIRQPGSMYRYGLISNSPSFLSRRESPPPSTYRVRPEFLEPGRQLKSRQSPSEAPHVYATFGSVYRPDTRTTRELLRAIGAKYRLVVAGFDARRARAALRPQTPFMDGCIAVICHGGRSTVLTAAREGVAVLCHPLGSDNQEIAEAAKAAGIGRITTLDPKEVIGHLEEVGTASWVESRKDVKSGISELPAVRELVATISSDFS